MPGRALFEDCAASKGVKPLVKGFLSAPLWLKEKGLSLRARRYPSVSVLNTHVLPTACCYRV